MEVLEERESGPNSLEQMIRSGEYDVGETQIT